MSAARLVEVREVPDATVRIGWFSRERVFIYCYDDGTRIVGYPVRARDGSTLAIVPLDTGDTLARRARDTLTGSSDE